MMCYYILAGFGPHLHLRIYRMWKWLLFARKFKRARGTSAVIARGTQYHGLREAKCDPEQ